MNGLTVSPQHMPLPLLACPIGPTVQGVACLLAAIKSHEPLSIWSGSAIRFPKHTMSVSCGVAASAGMQQAIPALA